MFRSVAARITGIGALVAAASLTVATVSITASGELKQSFGWVSHTQNVLKTIASSVGKLRQAESDLRLVVLNQDYSLGSAINADLVASARGMAKLVELTADNPAQSRRARELQSAVRVRSAYIAEGFQQLQAGRQDFTESKIRAARAQQMMAEITAIETEMQGTEEELWRSRTARAADLIRWNSQVMSFGGATVTLLVVMMVLYIRRAVREPSRRLMDAMEALDIGGSRERLDTGVMGSTEFARLARGYNAMVDRLDRASASQIRSEAELQSANQRLQEHSCALEDRSRIIERLGSMAHRMQAARTDAEFASVVACFAPHVLPGMSGAVYAHNNSRNHLVRIATWGDPPLDCIDHFEPHECWGLRLGQSHALTAPGEDILCSHVAHDRTAYHCEPLLAGGEVIGLLHLDSPVTAENRFRLNALVEDVASALVNHRLQRNLREQTIRDPLTGLFNRRYLEESLQTEIARAVRSKAPLTLVMCDIDHFKRFNDEFGHEAGDTVLQTVTAEMRSHFRDGDVLCRYGGEEFTVIAPGATPEIITPRIERLRHAIAGLQLRHGSRQLGSLSMSFGMAQFTDEMGRDGAALVQVADEALYRAKRDGRNRAVIAEQMAA